MATVPTSKRCRTCREDRPIREFAKAPSNKSGVKNQCRTCDADYHERWRTANKAYERERVAAAHRSDPARKMLSGAKRRAASKGLPFSLKYEDIHIPELCPVLGIRLFVGDGEAGPNSPSLDRIDNSRGYTKDNVLVVSYRANTLKSSASLAELRSITSFYERLLE